MKVSRIFSVVILLHLLLVASYGACMKPYQELDLSFFLLPNRYHIFVIPDGKGNLYVSQPELQEIIKIGPKGNIVWAGPREREGYVEFMDTTQRGDLLVVFARTGGLIAQGKSPLAMIFYEGKTMKKLREMPVKKLFDQGMLFLTDLRILKPEEKILIRGTFRNNQNSLHVLDFEGNLLYSFSEFNGDLRQKEVQADVLSPGYLTIDYQNKRIYQIFPLSGVIKAFNYEGKKIGEGIYYKAEVTKILAYKDGLIMEYFPIISSEGGSVRHKRGPFLKMYLEKNTLKASTEKIDYLPEIDGVLINCDDRGNFYFLSGKTRQILKVCRIEG